MADKSHFADKENALQHAPLTSSRASIGVGQAVNPRNTLSDIEFQVANPAFASIDERAVLRKMDVRLIPMLAMLYLMSFLDRGNIGNAKIEGLTDDLHMTGQDYSWALTAFFFTYVAIEVPANLLLKRLKPSIWFPMIMFAWGVVMTLMGTVQSFDGLVAARLFLGVAEGGLFPGIVYYITMWYCPHEAQYRQALFFAGAGMAGAFSGVLAFGIGKMSGVGGLEGWRWIFILEGLLTVVVAAASYFLMFDYPETATFLTENERAWVIERLKHQGSRESKCIVAQKETFQWKYVVAAFTDWQVLVAMFMNLGFMCPIYAISAFLPTIIQDLGYTAADAQLLSAPPYVAAAITAVVVAIFADRYGRRSPFVISCQILAAIGWMVIIIGSMKSISGLVYGGVFITVIGLYSGFPGNIAWISSNVAGGYKRSVALAIHVGFGNLGGIYSANWYRSQDAPQYILGHSLSLAVVVLGLIAALTLRFGYQQENRRRDAKGIPEGLTQEQMSNMGDRNPAFRYVR